MMKTRIIAGHKITLESGNWYIATRPINNGKRRVFPVSIRQEFRGEPIDVIDGLTYDQSNEFINEFNNGNLSFEGRIW